MNTRARHRAACALLLFVLIVSPTAAGAVDVMVLGTPHFADLEPKSGPRQEARVVESLMHFFPSQVCIEAVPGARIEAFAKDPVRYGELLALFAMDAIRLAPEQQARHALDPASARRAAGELIARGALTLADESLLISAQLAGFDLWSAVLNWSRLDEAGKKAVRASLGAHASERLEQLTQSRNEIARLAIPLARRLGYRELCAVDPFEDELDVAVLADGLQPLLGDPAIGDNLKAFDAWTKQGWSSEREDGLLRLLQRYNGPEFAGRDRAAQWEIFRNGAGDHPAGDRRLMLWHARNAAIQLELLRAMAGERGDRTLLIIGAAHRPFLEASLRALPWVQVHDPFALLTR